MHLVRFSNKIIEINTWVNAQLVNHGVSYSVLKNLIYEIVEFNKLPFCKIDLRFYSKELCIKLYLHFLPTHNRISW